jgi:hypothetical protein
MRQAMSGLSMPLFTSIERSGEKMGYSAAALTDRMNWAESHRADSGSPSV